MVQEVGSGSMAAAAVNQALLAFSKPHLSAAVLFCLRSEGLWVGSKRSTVWGTST